MQLYILQKKPWRRCFPVNFVEFVRTSFYRTLPDGYMSTLKKMVLHIASKTNIQKDLSKSQIFTRKIFVAKFRYSETIFCHSQ